MDKSGKTHVEKTHEENDCAEEAHVDKTHADNARVEKMHAEKTHVVYAHHHYHNRQWYVVQTVGGQEDRLVDLIAQFITSAAAVEQNPTGAGLVNEAFVPRYQLKKRYKGTWLLREEVLLPGYVFVITPNPKLLQQRLYGIPAFAKLLRNTESFAKLDQSEIQFINAFTNPDNRLIEMSEGVIEGDKIIILNGPLMSQTGLIKRIDRHKRLAYLEVDMLGRKVEIKVGLEIVQKT